MAIENISAKNNPRANYYKRAAVNGALTTAAVVGLSTTMDYFLRPQAIKNSIEQLGGKNKYIKSLLTATAFISVIGAVANTATAFIIEKMANKK